MTADRFGPIPSGEYTALAAARNATPLGPMAPEPGQQGWRAAPPVPPAAGRRAGHRRDRPAWVPLPPPQHGAWAFLIVPVLMAFAVSGASAAGWLFLAAWVCAYPVGYYGGRALTARVRRGSWTRLARRELSRAVPWAVLTALLGLPLAMTRPWLLLAAAVLALLWGAGLWVAARLGERSMANDLLLVAQAVAAVPMAVAVVAGPTALLGTLLAPTVTVALVCALYLTGSVVHVKSLLREAGSATYQTLDLAWHLLAAVGTGLLSPWWLLGFGPALLRTLVRRPGMRPGILGAVEAVVAVLVVLAAQLAV